MCEAKTPPHTLTASFHIHPSPISFVCVCVRLFVLVPARTRRSYFVCFFALKMNGELVFRFAHTKPPGGVDAHGTSIFVAEFGGTRYQNMTQCADDEYLCSTTGPPECMNAPGRNYTAINNCQCGCDVFHQMLSGHRVRVVRYASSGGSSSSSSSEAATVVETVCGSGIRGYRNGPAAEAEFDHPYDVAVFGTGAGAAGTPDLLIADALNHAVRLYVVIVFPPGHARADSSSHAEEEEEEEEEEAFLKKWLVGSSVPQKHNSAGLKSSSTCRGKSQLKLSL